MTSVKEDEDFVILADNVWKYLYKVYGGNDIPRVSIELQKEEEDSQSEFMIEIYLQKINIYILPKLRNHISLKKPSSVFISRKATI